MADEGQKTGLNAALQAVGPGEPPEEEGVQQALPFDQPALEQSLGLPPVQAPRRGAGRPPGARNRRTDAWTEFLLSRHSSPLQVLAETYSMPVEDLARRLRCDRAEAFKIQLLAAKELAPYVHQKQPLAVQVDQTGRIVLVLDDRPAPAAGGPAADGAPDLAIDVEYAEVNSEGNQ